jgi:hypothetical protein
MSRVEELLTRCRELGADIIPTQEGQLEVTAPAPLPDDVLEALRMNKQSILATLRPFINDRDELVIPSTAAPRYHWWAGGQSIAATLLELNAPPEIWTRYTRAPYKQVQ